jgi:hypothetical protein
MRRILCCFLATEGTERSMVKGFLLQVVSLIQVALSSNPHIYLHGLFHLS